MKDQLVAYMGRLRKPSTLLSLVSQVVSILLLLGIHINQSAVMAVAAAVCSLMVTLGILSNPDTAKNGYGDDILTCSVSGKKEKHVLVNGQMVCQNCGTVYQPTP